MKKHRIGIVLGVLAAAAIAAGGCARDGARGLSGDALAMRNPLAPIQSEPAKPDSAKPDSVPGHKPPKPDPQADVTVQSLAADSGLAGQTVTTRWRFGNLAHSAISVTWTLTDDAGWAGYPRQGSVDLPALGSSLVEVTVAIPETTRAGFYPNHMSAVPKHGATAIADGGVQVFGITLPPDSLVSSLR